MTPGRTITFTSDHYRLTGTLHLPEADRPPIVVGCHGLFANRNSPKQVALAKACVLEGFAYFRFDHRGCGDSQGDFAEVTSIQSRCRDLKRAVNTVQALPYLGSVAALFGSSFGGTVVLAYAAEHDSPALITYAAPIDSKSIRHANIRDNTGQVPPPGSLPRALAFDISPRLRHVKNVFISHSEGDETVPVAHAYQIHSHVGEPKKLTILKGGDHRMSTPSHQQDFESQFIEWIISSLS